MNESSATPECPAGRESGRNPLDELADSFVARLRNGERPSITQYVRMHPELADDIREMFPTLAMLEQAGSDDASNARMSLKEIPKQLGEYRILGKIGHGGMGVVYEAEHATMRRRVALKVMPAGAAVNPTHLRRFHREARAAGRLHHTNIVPVFEVGEDCGIHFYAMQYIRGQSLDLVIEELQRLQAARDPSATTPADSYHNARAQKLGQSVAKSLVSGQFEPPASTPADSDEPPAQGAPPQAVPGQDEPPTVISVRNAVPSTAEQAESASSGDDIEATEKRTYSSADILSKSGDFTESATVRNQYFHRVARIGLQVAEALDHAHGQGVLHRDIKPANLILDTAGVAWITDFGLAKNDNENLTGTGDIVGTMRYIAPERLSGKGDVRSDIYGLGLTLYELCTLRPAFEDVDRTRLLRRIAHEDPPAPRKINRSIPRDLETLILKAIDKQPGRRYQSAKTMVEDLRLFLADRPVQARRTTTTERAWRWCRRNPSLASLASCVALLMVVVFVGSVWFGFTSGRQAQQLQEQTELARRHEALARASETEALASLYEFRRTRAQAARTSGQRGQRAEGLAAIAQAAALLPRFQVSEAERAEARAQLRNDAIACMARVDLQNAATWNIEDPWTPMVDFDATFQKYAQSDDHGNVVVRRVKDDHELLRLPSPGYRAWKLRFSPDGRYLTVSYHPLRERVHFICVWEVASGRRVVREEGPMWFGDSAFSSDSRRFAIGMRDHTIRIHDLDQRSVIEPPLGTELQPFNLSYSPRGRWFVMADAMSPRFEMINLDDNSRQVIAAPAVIRSFGWSPDESLLVGGASDGGIYFWNTADLTAEPEGIHAHRGEVIQVFLNHRGDRLVSRSWDGTVRFWDVSSRRELLRTHGSLAIGNHFSPDDRLLGFATQKKTFGIWEVSDTGPLRILTSDVDARHGIEFCSSYPGVILAMTPRGVEIWDARTARRVADLPIGETVRATMTPDGKSLVTAGPTGLRRWAVSRDESNQWRITLSETIDQTPTDRLALSADGRWLAVSQRKTARVIDLIESDSRLEIGAQPDLHDVLISPDGRWIVTTSWAFGRGIQVWDRETGELASDLDSQSEARTAGTAAFSPDGSLLATVTMSGRAVWEVGSWRCLYFTPHDTEEGWPITAAFSQDNSLLALPHSRLSLQLVEPRSGRQLAILEAPDAVSVGQLAFNHDSTQLAVVVDNQIQMWDLRELRSGLAKIGLDYDLPAYATSVNGD
jgi:serine/threonine protein kinase/WD40 repeat protein